MLRSFVVKTGLHYGVDFTVYRTLPTLCHSEMCVAVVNGTGTPTTQKDLALNDCWDDGEEEECSDADESCVSWRHVSTVTRVVPVSSTATDAIWRFPFNPGAGVVPLVVRRT